ncbi:MAG: FGGY-family carbohydrate kinase [Roseiarcus sp.]
MAGDCVIGLDIGTTSTVGVLVRLPATILATASRPTALASPHPAWAEEDPAEWWRNSCAVLRELVAALPGAPAALRGICVTGMVPALVLLDAAGNVLRPSIQQSDARAAAEVAELAAEVDEAAFLARTGNGVNQQLIAPKLRWLERHELDLFARIRTAFGSYDYINWRLTGVAGVEQNWALEAGLVDLAQDAISADLVALTHLPRDAFPEKRVPHDVLGVVTREAARETGLPEGLPVFGGAADHIASALAAGLVNPGDALLKFGGAGDIVVASDVARPDWRLFLDYHLVPGLYAPNGCMASSGSALNWLAANLRLDAPGESAHRALDRLAGAVPPGGDGVLCLPYFLGEKTPVQDPLARGAFIGLSLSHTPAHFWRALLEAIAFGFRHHVEVLEEIGYAPRRFLASDGGSRSRVWMQIVADVLQAPVRLIENAHGSAVGAAFVAAVASGGDVGWADAGRLARLGDAILPQPANAAVYDRGYREYRALYAALRPIFRLRATR